MKFKQLLAELIQVSRKTKTEFAVHMHMTPSGLSKLLNGGTLPILKEKYLFSERAAAFFAEALFESGCYLKLHHIFPVLYVFNSQHDLEQFLTRAIEYVLDENYQAEINEYLDYSEQGTSYIGDRTILDMSCILISDFIQRDSNKKLEYYSFLTLISPFYKDALNNIRLSTQGNLGDWTGNFFIDLAEFEETDYRHNFDLFALLVKSERYMDLKLWQTNQHPDQSFLLLKDRFLLVYSSPLNGTPVLSVIRNKQYLSVFHTTLMKSNPKRISYSKNEATEFLKSSPEIRTGIMNLKIDAVYNFVPIGYMVEEKDIKSDDQSAVNKEVILKIFNTILTTETLFIVSLNTMKQVYSSKTVAVPLVEPVHFSKRNQLIAYMRRFDVYLSQKSSEKVKVVLGDFPPAAIFCTKEFSIVYIPTNNFQQEKYHFFRTELIRDLLEKHLSNQSVYSVSDGIWASYLREITARSGIYPEEG